MLAIRARGLDRGNYRLPYGIRVDRASGANLSRTFGSGYSRTRGTIVFDLKLSSVAHGSENNVLIGVHGGSAGSDTDRIQVDLSNTGATGGGDQLRILGDTTVLRRSSRVFRDPAGHFGLMIAWNTNDAAGANRIRAWYVGNLSDTAEIAWAATSNPSQGSDLAFGQSAVAAIIGQKMSNTGDFVISRFVYIDDQQITDPSVFWKLDTATGAYLPRNPTLTPGARDMLLEFRDVSAATAGALGRDRWNGLNWTPSNISVTAGSGCDALTDTPTSGGGGTSGGNVRGNFPVLNIVHPTNSAPTITNGALDYTRSGTAPTWTPATFALPTSGKWYWECDMTSSLAGAPLWTGLVTASRTVAEDDANNIAGVAPDAGWVGRQTNGSSVSAYISPGTISGVVTCHAYDAATGKYWAGYVSGGVTTWGTNGGVGDPAAGSNPLETIAGAVWPACGHYSTSGASRTITTVFNFGQRAFAGTPPTGFKPLCTQYLPAPAIKLPADYFAAKLYQGNGGTLNLTGNRFQPDLAWGKDREAATHHVLTDSTRGVGISTWTSSTGPEGVSEVTAFNADGVTITRNASHARLNDNGDDHVMWLWRTGFLPGLDIVGYTGDAVAGRQVPHALGVAPDFVALFPRTTSTNALVWHRDIGNDYQLYFNLTNARDTSVTTFLNDKAPTSAHFELPGTGLGSNNNGATYIAYLFAAVPGFSKFGVYAGNNSANGPFVYTGFRPAFVLLKRSTDTGDWMLYDSARDPHNGTSAKLYPNATLVENGNTSETGATNAIDILSNGFKLRTSNGNTNPSSASELVVYAAFAEAPLKYARAR